ncbi:MAG: glycoside hydrolase family 13 protein [bacterium]
MSEKGERFEGSWWREGVIYEIYPRSFADSNGDGVGDLPGLIGKLDYLNDGTPNSLGIDAIWLTPIYPSPLYDFGYDIKDYRDIDPIYGSLRDFDRLVAECHRRGIRVIMDLVMNHTSHEHPWFVESRSSRESPKRGWYIWRDGKGPGVPPNNWRSVFGGPSWEWDEATRQYYYHFFLKEQPDLNWRNPEVFEAMSEVVRFWLDRGVDGFRLDAINFLFEDPDLRDNPPKFGLRAFNRQEHIYDANLPETHDVLKKLRGITDEYPERMMVGEVYVFDPKEAAKYYGDGDELHLAFNFEFLRNRWGASGFRRSVAAWEEALSEVGYPTYVLSNHDQPRHYSRYSRGGKPDARAKVAAALLLTLRGTPFLYYGEEIGMRNVRIPKSQLKDPVGVRYWPLSVGRDPERTPMQWSGEAGAGFTKGTPWLPIAPDFRERNVASQSADPNSLLNFYRKLIWLRKRTPALLRGNYRCLDSENPDCFSFLRADGNQRVLVSLNFSSRPRIATFRRDNDVLGNVSRRRALLSTHRREGEEEGWGNLRLAPNEVYIGELI